MRKKNLIIIIGLIAFIAITIGVSYSYFVYNKDVADISLDMGHISIDLANVNGNLSLNDTVPKNDYFGTISSDYIDFAVNATVDTDEIYYEVYIMPKDGNTLDTNYLKLYLTDQNNNQISPIAVYNNLNSSTKAGGKSIYRGIFNANQSGTLKSYTKDFRLRMWLDEDYPETASKKFDFDIYLYAYNVSSGSDVSNNTFFDRNINATELSVPSNTKEGLTMYYKRLTVQNNSMANGSLKLTINRTSGLQLTDLSYAVIVNGAIQEIGDVPIGGEILLSAIMINETLDVGVRLWPKTSYAGAETTFVGELVPEIKYLGSTAASIENASGQYVKFNCNGNNCEIWQIVTIEDGRLVLTRQNDYEGAAERVDSHRYNSSLSFNDNSLITSVSTDNKNVYLAKTVKVSGGTGTVEDPYTLVNNVVREGDKKVIAVITYKDGTTTVGTQNIYYGETNYISQTSNSVIFSRWVNGNNTYYLGDTVNFTSDIILEAINRTSASNLEYINNTYQCTTVQQALDKIDAIIYGEE